MTENTALIVRTPDVIAGEINEIKTETFRFLHAATKHATMQSFEIGKRLIEAKELVPGGSWLDWLRDSVDYSEDTAQNLMRIAREYDPNSPAIQALSYSQLVALFTLPPAEREDFVKGTNAAELPVKDIKALIKEKERLEQELASREISLASSLKRAEMADQASENEKKAKDDLDVAKASLKREKEISAKLLKEKQKLEADLKKAKTVTPKVETVEKTVVEKVYEPSPEQISSLREEVEKELREQLAKEKSKETAKQNPALVELNVRFEQLQRVLADLSVSVSRLDEADRVKFAGLITKTVNDQLVRCFGG